MGGGLLEGPGCRCVINGIYGLDKTAIKELRAQSSSLVLDRSREGPRSGTLTLDLDGSCWAPRAWPRGPRSGTTARRRASAANTRCSAPWRKPVRRQMHATVPATSTTSTRWAFHSRLPQYRKSYPVVLEVRVGCAFFSELSVRALDALGK